MKLLQESESELIGGIEMIDGRPELDPASRRLAWLVENSLHHVADDASGWFSLFQDPRDGRYWERDFPNSGQAGGGAARLTVVSLSAASCKYRFDPTSY